jgi:NitT/TauT family transport system ATP-binding protein
VTAQTDMDVGSAEHRLMAGLTAVNVGVRYPNRRERRWFVAVRSASFTVPPGAFVSLIGPSGSGKSSLLRAVAGLTPRFVGDLTIDGVPIDGPGDNRAMVFQFDRLLPWRTVLRNVTLGMEIRGVRKRLADRRAREVLELVGLSGYEDSYPSPLSGGMRQRVNLARALAIDPAILLLDEPFASLDAQTRELMADELLRIWAESRKTALFVTHSIDEAVFMSDTVLVLSNGPESTIVRTVDIQLPRPRTPALRDATEFRAYVGELREELNHKRNTRQSARHTPKNQQIPS